jgi:glycosyltransferase involved in cell wall biosynthesis
MNRTHARVRWYQRLIRREHVDGFTVIRTFSYEEKRRTGVGRLLGFASFTLSCCAGLLAQPKPDVLLASSPPLFPMLPALLYSKWRRVPLVLEIRDLWPDSAVQMGLLHNRVLISLMRRLEHSLYDHAQAIITLTDGIRDDIEARGWPTGKLHVITCGVDFEALHPDPDAGAQLRGERGWEEHFVVMYFGALGQANNLSVLLRAAKRLRDTHPEVRFVLVGDGVERAAIERKLRIESMDNVELLSPVPKSEARRYLNAADTCVATLLDIDLFKGAIPTKLIDYMACGRPVLCGVRGEAQRIVEAARSGLTFPPDDDMQLAKLLVQLAEDPSQCDAFGRSGAKWAHQNFSAVARRELSEALLMDVVSRSGQCPRSC